MALQDSLSAEGRIVRLRRRLPDTYQRLWLAARQVRILQADISLFTPAATVDEQTARRELVGCLGAERVLPAGLAQAWGWETV